MRSEWRDFLTGSSSKESWKPEMTVNTTTSDYWLNWRVLLCGIWVLISVVSSLFIVLKNECCWGSREREVNRGCGGLLFGDEVWKACLRSIHPVWLLLYRLFAFFVLSALLIINGLVDGPGIFYFYTQWTFTSITVYFGIGSFLSIHGCYKKHREFVSDEKLDTEQGKHGYDSKHSTHHFVPHGRETVGFIACLFQIIFQMNAGAVVLTDCVFWFIIVPFLAIKDYNLSFLIINMHSINAVFLLGETALNCLQFPWFRIGYFFLWTSIYVAVQWLVHAFVSIWWPYPFLDLSSSWAPLWYLLVGLMHIPCYAFFRLIMKLKHFVLARWFPESYECMK